MQNTSIHEYFRTKMLENPRQCESVAFVYHVDGASFFAQRSLARYYRRAEAMRIVEPMKQAKVTDFNS